jgi:hypothetical protein
MYAENLVKIMQKNFLQYQYLKEESRKKSNRKPIKLMQLEYSRNKFLAQGLSFKEPLKGKNFLENALLNMVANIWFQNIPHRSKKELFQVIEPNYQIPRNWLYDYLKILPTK